MSEAFCWLGGLEVFLGASRRSCCCHLQWGSVSKDLNGWECWYRWRHWPPGGLRTNDPVFLSSCGLLILADLARQQPMVPPESLVAFSLLIGASIHPSDLGPLEAVPLVMVLAGFASKGWPFATPARTFCTRILVGLSWGLLVAEVWVHFLPLG